MLISAHLLLLNGAIYFSNSLYSAKGESAGNFEQRFIIDEYLPLILTSLIKEARYDDAKRVASVNLDQFGLKLESYAGYLTVDERLNSNLWFWYFPVRKQPVDTTPLIIWLQGGLSMSSLFGLFHEIGPLEYYNTTTEELGFKIKDFSWGGQHSLLFIDNPVGAGYSFTEDYSGYASNEEVIGKQLYSALQQFMTLFSELRSAPLVIAGQAYGGKHATSLAIQIHRHGESNINLMGLMISSSLVNPGATLGHGEFAHNTGLIDKHVANHMMALELQAKASLDRNDLRIAHSYYLNILGLFRDAGVRNLVNYLSEKPITENPSWSFHLHTWMKLMLHAGNTTFPQYDAVRVKLLPDYMNNTQGWLEELLDHYRVLFYSGQLDALVPFAVLDKFYHSLDWSDRDKFHRTKRSSWYHRGTLAGYHKSGGKLTTVMVRGAGHLVPAEQPERTLALISAFIQDKSLDVDTGW